jgi:hypothetical protein
MNIGSPLESAFVGGAIHSEMHFRRFADTTTTIIHGTTMPKDVGVTDAIRGWRRCPFLIAHHAFRSQQFGHLTRGNLATHNR